MQDELESGYLDYRDNISANGGNAWVAPVGLAFEHIHDKIVAEGGTPTNSGNTFYNLYTNDGSHPSLSGSYLAAVVLYATITGNDPVGLSHSTSLSNGLVLELQQAAAATVFNETSHLDYPWQTTSSNQNTSLSFVPNVEKVHRYRQTMYSYLVLFRMQTQLVLTVLSMMMVKLQWYSKKAQLDNGKITGVAAYLYKYPQSGYSGLMVDLIEEQRIDLDSNFTNFNQW